MKTHKGLEELIKSTARRIKEFEDTRDPTVMGANKLLLELTQERLEAHLDAWQRGRPSVDAEGTLSRFFRSMGFIPTMYTSTAHHGLANYAEHKVRCEKMGFPADKLCDKVVSQMAMLDADDLPKPDVIYSDSHGCDNDHKYYSQSFGDLFNIPVYFVDFPLHEDDKPTLDSINYIADQMGQFIEWAEKKVPGIKYDEDKYIEMLELDTIAQKYCREIYQLAKKVPSPIAPLEALAGFFDMGGAMPSHFPNMQKALKYLQVFRDEVGERVASGKGPYPEERLRLLWAGQRHGLQTLNPSKLLLERKVALPLAVVGMTIGWVGVRDAPYFGEVSEFGVKLSPLQEEARCRSVSCWGGPGKRWSNWILKAAKDIGAQGILHFNLIGCTPMRGMGSVVAERAEKELGIPTLNFEGRYLDKDFMSQEKFNEILSVFLDKCFDWAGKPRQ